MANLNVIDHGVFYLDLREHATAHILADIDQCIIAAHSFYGLPLAEKLVFDIDKIGALKTNGYKPTGRNTGAAKGKKDGFEAFLIPRDGICNPDQGGKHETLPPVFEAQRKLLISLMNDLHEVGEGLLSALGSILSFEHEATFKESHRRGVSSTSALGILRYSTLSAENPQLGQSAHTDVGSLTLLFCDKPGLQILDPETDVWSFVKPKHGHVIVNIGDSLRFLSESKLRSCLHRVVPYENAHLDQRYSCAYFLRPELDTCLTTDTGGRSVDWHLQKYAVFRAPVHVQEASSVLTGRHGYVGLWNSRGSDKVATK